MDRGVDLRIVKTKAKLRGAFAKMMQTKSFDDITVFDLCDAAEVRRATFYRHYTDKYHFLSCIVSTIIEEIVAKVGTIEENDNPIDYYCNYVREVIEYFKAKNSLMKNIIESSAFSTVKDIVLHGTLSSFKHDLSKSLGSGAELPARVDILSEFLNGGIAHIVILWLTNDNVSDEAVLESVRSLLTKLLH